MHFYLKNHPIWKENEFWECAALGSLIEQISDEKQTKLRENENIDESSIREKNLIFSQLAAFSHNMLLFELDKNIVKETMNKIGGFCFLFKLQLEDLSVKTNFIFF